MYLSARIWEKDVEIWSMKLKLAGSEITVDIELYNW